MPKSQLFKSKPFMFGFIAGGLFEAIAIMVFIRLMI